MDDKKPKLQAWNFDSQVLENRPEMQRQEPVNWSKVGNSMSQDVNQRMTIKWYFNVPIVFVIFLIAFFVSGLLAAILIIVYFTRIITTIARAPASPSKNGSLVAWSLLGLVFLGVVALIS